MSKFNFYGYVYGAGSNEISLNKSQFCNLFGCTRSQISSPSACFFTDRFEFDNGAVYDRFHKHQLIGGWYYADK